MSWLSGWDYRKSHVINPATNAGTGYQISLTVHYGSGSQTYLYGEWRNFSSNDLYAVQAYGSAGYRFGAYDNDYSAAAISGLNTPHDYWIGWRASDIKCYIDDTLETTISSQITSSNKKASFYADNGWIKCAHQ